MLPSLGVLLRIAWRQYLNRFDVILYGHLLFTLPVVALTVYGKQYLTLPETITGWRDVWPNLFIQLGMDYTAGILTSIVVVMIIITMQAAAHKQALSFSAILKAAMPFYPAAILVGCIEILATSLGLAALVIPGIIISALFALVLPALVWHKFSISKALRHVWQLAHGRLFWVVSYLLSAQVLVTLVLFLVVWGLPISIWFDLFAGFVGAICASYYTVFTVILLNALATTQKK